MTKKLLATSLFTACLVSTTLSSGLASDGETYFYPKYKWVIEEVGGGAGGGLKTCALVNKLNNGYIVQISGNSGGFVNFNIDFRQNSFEQDRDYKVKYSIPGVFENVIPTKAFKENLLVSDLRNEVGFSGYLSSASVLDVEIGSTEFRMYLTGLSAAMGGYKDCVNPHKVLELENPHIDLFANANNGVPEQVSVADLDDVQLENVDIAPPPPKVDMPSEDIEQESITSVGGDMPQDIAPTTDYKLRPPASIKPRYTEHLAQQLKEESNNYKPEIITGKTKEITKEIDSGVKPEISILSVNEKINSNPNPLSNSSVGILYEEKLTLEDITWEETNSINTMQQIENVASESFEVASAEPINDMAEMLANIEPIAGTSDSDFVSTRDKVSDLEAQIEVLLNKNNMLDEELKSILLDAEDERMSVSSDNWDLERATMKFNEAERQIMRLGRKLQTHKVQCEYDKTELENMLFDPKLTNKNQLANLTLLEEEIDSVKSDLYRQQRQYEERIRLLEKQLETQ